MHRNLTEKEHLILCLAVTHQRELLNEAIANQTENNESKRSLEILDGLEKKLTKKAGDKDVLRASEAGVTIGYTLIEVQSLYAALFMFRAMNAQFLFGNVHDLIPEDEKDDVEISRQDLIEYVSFLTEMLTELEKSFNAKGIEVSDFMTVHDDYESFYKATDINIGNGASRNSPCQCGSGKKFKHCCGK